ncbi:dCMP deaminase family protein [Patescibacteria group bacterium]|nr:dCMP deaminase family protein [Patescibacteria group bacterium]
MERKYRPGWEEIWFKIVGIISRRSVCLYYKVGAVIARDKQFLAMGYNGPPKGVAHCDKVGCAKIVKGVNRKHQGLCRGAHAELNAIANAASLGINISGADMYVTFRPCAICVKTIINSGIKRVFYLKEYKGDEVAWDYVKQSNLVLRKVVFENKKA